MSKPLTKREEEIVQILLAEFGYWKDGDFEESPHRMALECGSMIAAGALSNVLVAIVGRTKPEKYKAQIKARG